MSPNAAPLVAGLLGPKRVAALDVGAACTGWLAALAVACGQIESGRARHVLVIGADVLSPPSLTRRCRLAEWRPRTSTCSSTPGELAHHPGSRSAARAPDRPAGGLRGALCELLGGDPSDRAVRGAVRRAAAIGASGAACGVRRRLHVGRDRSRVARSQLRRSGGYRLTPAGPDHLWLGGTRLPPSLAMPIAQHHA
jgi:3-Oxoacyl-[acyl-carrier-protein (ACP)] synthase III